jgi:hypothetical protein
MNTKNYIGPHSGFSTAIPALEAVNECAINVCTMSKQLQ